jgi:hypothetical protein
MRPGFRLLPLNRVCCVPELCCAGRYDLRRDRPRNIALLSHATKWSVLPGCIHHVQVGYRTVDLARELCWGRCLSGSSQG